MPYKSRAQEEYFNANRKKLEAQGVNVDEWNAASKGKKLPQKVKKQSGGDLHERSYVDSTLNANKQLNFVQRYLHPSQYPVINNPDGTYSTHLMGQMDNFAFPTIIQDSNGKLVKMSMQDAYNYAIKNKQYIQFPSEQDAEWFADNGYKKGTQYKTGGMKKKKYQFAGSNPCGEGTQWDDQSMQCVPIPKNPNADPVFKQDYSGSSTGFQEGATTRADGKVIPSQTLPLTLDGYFNANAGAITKRGDFIQQQNVIGDAVDKGYNLDSDGTYRKLGYTTNNNILGYNDTFKALNLGFDAMQGLGNVFNDANTKRQERYNLQKARYNTSAFNPYETGLNKVPIYKTGGDSIEINPAHKGLFTQEAKEHGMSVAGFAAKVLANKDQYSAAVVKRANFAHNFAHQNGGMAQQQNCPNGDCTGGGGIHLQLPSFLNDPAKRDDRKQRKADILYYNGPQEQWLQDRAGFYKNNTDFGKYPAHSFDPQPNQNGVYYGPGNNPIFNNELTPPYTPNIATAQRGGMVNSTGYTPGTDSYTNPYNIIPSNQITMANTPFPVMAHPDNGNPVLMQPGQNYNFKGAKYVTEIPHIKQNPLQINNDPNYNMNAQYNFKNGNAVNVGYDGNFNVGVKLNLKKGGKAKHNKHWTDQDNDNDNMFDFDADDMAYGGIHIKKSHEGKFTAYKKRTGQTTEEALHSKDPHVRAMAQFAANSAKWHHQNGGEYKQGQQIQQIMQQCAEELKAGKTPQQILQQLVKSGISQKEGATIIQNVMQHLQQGQQQKGQMQTGGDVPEVQDQQQGNAELEQGEVFQNQQGGIQKVSEQDDTHEDGGSMQPNVSRVLEDTSDKRKDKDSKALLITPTQAQGIVGFKPKGSVSHSKLYEKATQKYDSKLKTFTNKIDDNLEYIKQNGGIYAKNSLEQNLKLLDTMATKGSIFDAIYDHQENIKQLNGIGDPNQQQKYGGKKMKYQVGGSKKYILSDKSNPNLYDNSTYTADEIKSLYGLNDQDVQDMIKNGIATEAPSSTGVTTYSGGKTQKGRITPTGQDNAFAYKGDLPAYQNAWQQAGLNLQGYNTNSDAQGAVYDYILKNNPDVLRNMWKQYGNTAQGINQGLPSTFDDAYLKDPNNLQKLRSAYTDNMFGVRTLTPQNLPQQTQDNTTPPIQYNTPNGVQASKFNMPLKWYDVAGNIDNYLSSSERTPVSFEQLQRQPLRAHELNPQPALDANQGDYNAALQTLPNNGVGYANQANLLANKYKVNNETVGNYASQNNQIADRVDELNNTNKYQLDATNLGLRQTAVEQQLKGMEVERQSKLNAFDDYLTKLAQNAQLNTNGNLVLQMTPYFNQQGQFNGNRYVFQTQPDGSQFVLDKKTGKLQKTITTDPEGMVKQTKTYIRS